MKRLATILRTIAHWFDRDWNRMWSKKFDRPELL